MVRKGNEQERCCLLVFAGFLTGRDDNLSYRAHSLETMISFETTNVVERRHFSIDMAVKKRFLVGAIHGDFLAEPCCPEERLPETLNTHGSNG
jgi:hypothetical protein